MSNIVGPKALVFSAGGLFAVYQAGVYRALWPHWRPDIVVGASAGALNAWIVASCAPPDVLVDEWLHPDSAGMIQARNPAPILERARRLQREFPRRLPLGIVSIQLPRFRPHLFRDDEITPEHLVATCSIPLFYPVAQVGGRRLVDGGLLENTPVWAAAAMGARNVIAINCLDRVLPRPVYVVIGAMRRLRRVPVPDGIAVHVLRPSEWLGTARQAMTWDRGNIERWLNLGMKDGEEFVRAEF